MKHRATADTPPPSAAAPALDRLIEGPELRQRIPLDRSTIYRMCKANRFPQPVKLTERRIAWRERDVVAWLESRASLAR